MGRCLFQQEGPETVLVGVRSPSLGDLGKAPFLSGSQIVLRLHKMKNSMLLVLAVSPSFRETCFASFPTWEGLPGFGLLPLGVKTDAGLCGLSGIMLIINYPLIPWD